MVNTSVNQTLSRTIITAGTTFLAVLSLYLFGGEVLEGFAFTMLVGIVSGTYSTVFIAAAIAILLERAGQAHGADRRQHGRRRRRHSSWISLAAALLGVVQGLTEFLPVSSSGHLILARAFFGWDPGRFGLAFDVACHVGTLLAVVAYFRTDVARLTVAAPGALAGRDGDVGAAGPADRRRHDSGGDRRRAVRRCHRDDAAIAGGRGGHPGVGAIGLLVAEWTGAQAAGRGIDRLRRGVRHRRGPGVGAGAGRLAIGRDADDRDAARACGAKRRRDSCSS